MEPLKIYYKRKCISCLNKVIIVVTAPNELTQAACPKCGGVVRIWN